MRGCATRVVTKACGFRLRSCYLTLEPLDHAGDRLAEADAHRGDAVAGVAALQLGDERRGDAGAGRAERVTQGDAPAVRVHVAGVVPLLETGVGQELQDDRRERLVDLDDLDVVP